MEILPVVILMLLLVAVTWLPVGILTLKTYVFLTDKEIVIYDFTPKINRNIVVCGWISFAVFIIMLPIDIFVRPFADALKQRFGSK